MAYDDYNTPDWNQFLTSNQPMVPNPQMMQPNPQTPASTYPAVDYRAQLQSMLTPYQNMAQQYSQPYNAFQPGSLLGKILPGDMQQRLSNGILVGSMIPQGQTAGQNISGVMQGLVGANQFERQRAMQGAMMPYEMVGQQLKMQDTLAQMQQRQEEIPYMHAREQEYEAQAAARDRYMQQPNAMAEEINMGAGAAGVTGPQSEWTPQQWQQVMSNVNQMRMRAATAGSGLTPGHITQMQMDASGLKPGTQAYADKAQKTYMSLMAGTAGASAASRTTAEQDVKQPQVDVDSEVKEFLNSRQKNYEDPMTQPQYAAMQEKPDSAYAPGGWNTKSDKDKNAEYQAYRQTVVTASNAGKQKDMAIVSGYKAAAKKNHGLQMNDYLQQSASQGPSKGGTPSPTAPSNRPPGW